MNILALFLFSALLTPQFVPLSAEMSPKISLESSSSEVSPGSDFTLSIFLDTDSPINALDLSLDFPASDVGFVDADKTSSIIDIWPSSPKETAPGTVTFAGGLLKAYSGTRALLAKLHFHTIKNPQIATLEQFTITENNLYMANGLGTKIGAAVSPLYITIIPQDAGEVAGANEEKPASLYTDSTPPLFEFRLAQNLIDGSSIAVLYASDIESGIKTIEMRTKIGLKWSAWRSVENFSPLPEGAWVAQARATNNAGLVSSQKRFLLGELLREIRIPLLVLGIFLLIGIGVYFHYRKLYNKYKNPYV